MALKGCPFCGSEPRAVVSYLTPNLMAFKIFCPKCVDVEKKCSLASEDGGFSFGHVTAIMDKTAEAWNTRKN